MKKAPYLPADQAVWVNIGKKKMKVHFMWDLFKYGVGWNGLDVAAYVTGGMSWWPCGRTFQVGGIDGFKEDSGTEWCECSVCREMRSTLKALNEDIIEWGTILGEIEASDEWE